VKEKSTRGVFRKNGFIVSKIQTWSKKKERARANQKNDATRLIYDSVTRALYNLLIALSAYR